MAAIKLIIVKYLEEVDAPQRVNPACYDHQKRQASGHLVLVFVQVWIESYGIIPPVNVSMLMSLSMSVKALLAWLNPS